MKGDRYPYACVFCGAPSGREPADQDPPADYCHDSDHEPFDEPTDEPEDNQ